MSTRTRFAAVVAKGSDWSEVMAIINRTWVAVILLFLPLPIIIVAISSFSKTGYLEFPPSALSLRWYEAFLNDPTWLVPVGISVLLAAVVAIHALTGCLRPSLKRASMAVC